MTNITELAAHMRGLAEAAKGWGLDTIRDATDEDECQIGLTNEHEEFNPLITVDCENYYGNSRPLAEFIIAANPANMITILDALAAAQAAVARLETLAKGQHVELYNARLRLAESEAQNLMARQIILEHGEGVAGASPVEPSQALSLDLLERLNKTLTRLGYATPEGGMEHFNADLANQLYNLCRAVDSLFDREQPPAPGEAAREYMTGYSDCKEWAQLSQDADPNAPWLSEAHMLCTDQGIAQGNITERIRALRDKLVQPSQAGELVNTQRVCFIRGWDARGMFSGPESSEERDMRMRELLDTYYPRAVINAKGATP